MCLTPCTDLNLGRESNFHKVDFWISVAKQNDSSAWKIVLVQRQKEEDEVHTCFLWCGVLRVVVINGKVGVGDTHIVIQIGHGGHGGIHHN